MMSEANHFGDGRVTFHLDVEDAEKEVRSSLNDALRAYEEATTSAAFEPQRALRQEIKKLRLKLDQLAEMRKTYEGFVPPALIRREDHAVMGRPPARRSF
jgi:hypothetical protein